MDVILKLGIAAIVPVYAYKWHNVTAGHRIVVKSRVFAAKKLFIV
jgi:hypothetical protein